MSYLALLGPNHPTTHDMARLMFVNRLSLSGKGNKFYGFFS